VIDAAALEKGSPVPQLQNQGGFGFSFLPEVIRKEQPHVVLIYNDMAVVSRFLEEIRKSGIPRNFKIWVYVDQVYNTQLQAFIDILNRDADRIFTFTSYWKKCIKDQGVTRPVDVLGHGFDRDMFKPLPREQARKALGIPNDAFVYISLNRNQPRKRYDLLIMAFVELVVKYPTKPIHLLCICDKGEKGGWWLFEIFMRELKLRGVPVDQFGGRLMVSSQDMQFKDEDINMFYNMADVGVSTADGEGWGLCNFEQMGVGVPQVVPDIGGYKEFCLADNSVLVKPSSRYYLPMAYCPVFGEAEACDPHDLCIGMEEYLLDSDKKKKHGEAARAKVLEYTWEKVTETFVKLIKGEHEEKEENA
jgi:glycosyltransferase involved in cell wall biosynthesis